jgi:hypothetical protein
MVRSPCALWSMRPMWDSRVLWQKDPACGFCTRLIAIMFIAHLTTTGCKPCVWAFFSIPTTGLVNTGKHHRDNVGCCTAGRVLWVLCRTPGGKHSPPSKSPEFGAVFVIKKCAPRAAEGGVVWLWFQSRVFLCLWPVPGARARPRAHHPQAP